MTTPAQYDSMLNECYNKFYSRVFHMEISPKKLVSLAVIAMEVVEPTAVDGSVQKSIVMKMVQRFINASPINEQSKKYYLKLVENGMLSACVEVIIAASKGKIGVNSPVVVKKSGCFA
jgi:hypothetical protein